MRKLLRHSGHGWQGSKTPSCDGGPRSGGQEAVLRASLGQLKAAQYRVKSLLDQAVRLQAEIDEKISKFGEPHQKPLPFIAYAIRHRRTGKL